MPLNVYDAIDDLHDLLPGLMPQIEDYSEVAPGFLGYAWENEQGTMAFGIRDDGRRFFTYAIPDHGSHATEAEEDDTLALNRFLAAAETYAERSHDPWDCEADWGYADARVVGTDRWEDEEGMKALRASLKIPEDWFLVKVINFGLPGRSLKEIEAWLSENALGEYRRVGWSSNCTTKVGIGFAEQNDAFFFHLRWR